MHGEEVRGPVTIVTACMRANGLPTFAMTTVRVTPDDYENGVHILLAEERLLAEGYEEPFVHFPETEAPPFLLPAVKAFLAESLEADVPVLAFHKEEVACHA